MKVLNVEVSKDEGAGVIFEPWSNGVAVGYRVTHLATMTVEYVYLNPSGHSDEAPDVFLYMGPDGDPNGEDSPEHFYSVLDSVFRDKNGILKANKVK